MHFTIVGDIEGIECIAISGSIREIQRLHRLYGQGRWRKMKGMAMIRVADGPLCRAEIHWYEAHGIGRKEFKIKRIVE